MTPKPWEGKHIWIWMLSQAGPLHSVIRRAVNMGLSGIMIKSWDGGTSGLFLDQLHKIVGPAHEAGLTVGAWGYSYGHNAVPEAKAMKKALDAGADWLIIDAEDEYENREGKTNALKLGIEVIRAMGTKTTLGYTTFALPQYHDAFPYSEFSSFCSVCLPQIYWGLMDFPLDEIFAMSMRGLSKYKVPIAPVGQCYGEVTAKQIIHFSHLARVNDLKGISYYSWQHASEAQLDAIEKALYAKQGNHLRGSEFPVYPEHGEFEVSEKTRRYFSVFKKLLKFIYKDDECELK